MSDLPPYARVTAKERAALLALCMEYVWRTDNDQSDRIPDLFVEDALWTSPQMTMKGRDGLITGWAEMQAVGLTVQRRHMISNHRYTREDDGSVRGVLSFALYRARRGDNVQPMPTLLADHVDEYAQVDGRWLFKSRAVMPLMPHDWTPPRID
jgi:3-phenylpropionate/cinnamic acid dioxygenase small subunit